MKTTKSSAFNRVGVFLIVAVLALLLAVFVYYSFINIRKPRNVILISIDTCRADYLGCYGYEGNTTPNIDNLAKEGVVFENVVSPLPLTLPAHCSMLTGVDIRSHGVHDNEGYVLDNGQVTLAEILKSENFATCAVVSSFVLDNQFGPSQGFDTYQDRFDDVSNSMGILERRGGEVTRQANLWLQANRGERFFLFIHYFDPHLPMNRRSRLRRTLQRIFTQGR